jgi:hypothetical protein
MRGTPSSSKCRPIISMNPSVALVILGSLRVIRAWTERRYESLIV